MPPKKTVRKLNYRPKSKSRTMKKKTSYVPKSLKTYVKSQIHRNIENKINIGYQANLPIRTAGVVSGAYTLPTNISLLPGTSQAITQSGRIGNQIKLTKGIVRGYVNCLPTNGTTNPQPAPIYVKMWLISSRTVNTNDLFNTPINTGFFQTGNTTIGFQTTMLDMLFRVNKDLFIVHATKQFKLGVGSPNTSTTQPFNTAFNIFDNSSFSLPFTFNWGKHFKAMLKYNDATDYPTNKNCFLVFQAVQATGSSGTLTSDSAYAEVHYVNEIEYEDA